MPDGSQLITQTPTWREAIKPGDILLFRCPGVGDDSATVEARPCLVIETPIIDGDVYVELACGTASMAKIYTGHEVRLRRPADFRRAGLDEPTRFLIAHRLMIQLTHSGFINCAATLSPVVGSLSGPTRARMDAVRARLADDVARSRRRRKRKPLRHRNSEINSDGLQHADGRHNRGGSIR
jgi:hypothetical protein